MLKHLSKLMVLMLIPLLLSGCFLSTSLEYIPYQDYVTPLNNKNNIDTDTYYQVEKYDELTYADLNGNQHIIDDFRDVYSSSNNGRPYLNMNSLGEQNLLVIPVSFTDSDKKNQNEKLIHLQNAFFGSKEKNISESVASFYNVSSYGHLKLKGKVSDFFNLNMSSSQLQNKINSKTNASRYVASNAIEWYMNNYDDISLFDNDNDKYIDGVFIVYDAPYVANNKQNSLFWAYTDHMKKSETISFKDGTKEVVNDKEYCVSTYAWASYYFTNVNNNYVDSHVFIHETGHIFGLQDYYSNGVYQPLGYLDMMDYNIGDHNAYSKMLLNWTTPYVIKDEMTITISPTITSGETILIPCKKWNNTPYDEFLLIEYYAPIGVNAYDSKLSFSYQNSQNEVKTGKIFTNYGIKLYHVDATLAYIKNKGLGTIISLFDDPDVEQKLADYVLDCEQNELYPTYCIDFAYTNNNANHPFISLLESSGQNSFKNGEAATNETLFRQGDSFGIDTYQDFTFYDGSSLLFAFRVDKLTSQSATITFIKK